MNPSLRNRPAQQLLTQVSPSTTAHCPKLLQYTIGGLALAFQLGTIALVACAGSLSLGQVASAEGSRELTASGGDRPYLEWRPTLSSGIPRKTFIKTYAEVGETINLGSSAVGIGNGIINYRSPSGIPGSCGTNGAILNRAQESAGSGVGYVPCIVAVTERGVWEIDFVSPDETSAANPTPLVATGAWAQPSGVGYVSAWDVTVRKAGTEVKGRTFSNAIAWNMGNNGRSLSSSLYVLTKDGYQYGIDLNGLDPFGFIFFANSLGFEKGPGNPIYRSLQFTGANPGVFPPGYSVKDPNAPDTLVEITHKLFINKPDSAIPTSAPSASGNVWLLTSPVPPPAATNLTFTGTEGVPGQLGISPSAGVLGGNFKFDASGVGSYTLTLDINNNGTYGDGNDRVLQGTSVNGVNTIFWDGKDGNGADVPATTLGFGAQAIIYAGEAHFPMLDAETNPNGLIINRLNQPPGGTFSNPRLIYFNDKNSGSSGTDYSLCATGEGPSSTCYGSSMVRSALLGVDSGTLGSSGGAHSYGTNFGDIRGIDTWVYYPSTPATTSGRIVVKINDLDVQKTDNLTAIRAGSDTTYLITITNKGPSDAVGASFKDTLPASLINASWSCAITTGTGSCTTPSGSGNTIDTTFNLAKNGVITYTVKATVDPAATGTITNKGVVVRPKDTTDPDLSNNQATDTTTVLPGVSISGQVWDDGDGSISINGAPLEVGTNAAGLTVYAIDGSGKVVGKSMPAADGKYSISGLAPNSTYTLRLSTDATKQLNDLAPTTATLPTGWISTGESQNGIVEIVTPGDLTAATTTTDLTNYNFGIEQSPNAVGATASSQPNPGGTTSVSVPPALFNTSTDPDGSVVKYRITGFPATATSLTITQGGVITTYTSATFPSIGLTILLAELSTLKVDPIDNNNGGAPFDVVIPFMAVDNAGKESANLANAILPFTAPISMVPSLRLVKRVSAINVKQSDGTFARTAIADFNDVLTGIGAADDNAPGWPVTPPVYLQGAFDQTQVPVAIAPKPGDEVEYTIYFLSDGMVSAQNVALCDFVPSNSTYINGTLQMQLGTGAVSTIPDPIGPTGGSYPVAPFPSACNGANNGNGAVLVNVGTVTNSTGPGTPTASYGFIRFRAKVN
jgi:uncharacterized repeat protein (TIGR01451 family)